MKVQQNTDNFVKYEKKTNKQTKTIYKIKPVHMLLYLHGFGITRALSCIHFRF